VDTQQHFENQEEIDKLRMRNVELKKELEREQVLHKMLYKEWKELSEQMSAKEQEVYENSKPKNLFYKYAFYVLVMALIPAFYFLYQRTGNGKILSSSPVVSDPIRTSDSTPTMKDMQTSKQNVTQQPAPEQPAIQSEEKKPIGHDSTKPARLIVHKPVIETPLTDDVRDSISSLGFSAYFDHHRNPFRKSSERYKVWAEGWNDGKAEAKKVLEKNPSLKH
jgi:hypothetical protein